MPRPDCLFVIPPVSLQFTSNVQQTVLVNINPLSTQNFQVIFTLPHNPATFDNNGKTRELPVPPKDPFGNEDYDLNITIKKNANVNGPVFTQLKVFVVSSSGTSLVDEIPITIN